MGNDRSYDSSRSNCADCPVSLHFFIMCFLTFLGLAFTLRTSFIVFAFTAFAIITIPAFLFPAIPLTLQLFLPLVLRFDLLDPLVMTALLLFHLTVIVLLAPV